MPETHTSNIADDNTLEQQQARAAVKMWLSRITAAKKKWEDDFKRMKADMEFVTGMQWVNQKTMDDDRYTVNLTLRLVNRKVADLYAKNPIAVATRRDRMYFQVWDEKIETLTETIMQTMQAQAMGMPVPLETMALFADFQAGKQRQQLIDQFCRTLRIVYQYQVDAHHPDFKEQMKQLVRRVIICGVGYVRLYFCRDQDEEYNKVSTIDTKSGVSDRLGRIRALTTRLQEGDVDETSEQFQTLRSLVRSVGASEAMQDDFTLPERLEFDFPPATSVIPDPCCRSLKDFVGARWVAQEYKLPVDEVNAIFGTDIKVGSGVGQAKEYGTNSADQKPGADAAGKPAEEPKQVCLYEIFDYRTKTSFFVCDGYNDYVEAPASPNPAVSGFWPVFSLTFNDVESVGDDSKASPFPPSDVQLAKSAQKEWNRSREALRDQRNANAPKYPVRDGLLTEEDEEKIRNAVPNSVLKLKGIPPDMAPDQFIRPLQMAPIDPRMYDTAPLEQDLSLGVGMQQANIGPALPNVTATVGSIAEQSRLNVSASNVDDLDGVLSRLAQAGAEMLIQAMSKEMVLQIAGPGAVWPELDASRRDFLNEVLMTVQASSSGRPNKAIEIQNFQQIAPVLLQAGANPLGVVQEGVKRLDDNLDITNFMPILPPAPAAGSGGQPPPEQSQKPAKSSGRPGAMAPPEGPSGPLVAQSEQAV